ncbi:ice-binding family protein [Flavobacterium pallidum]|uniref:Secretion system C-terminal sorting domain-containing protein n=1 Tax=Flavobacterium pallidum TaxID=2172098 RepID=A0A2S1SFV4_9FLAO|nr:ice-binding family protein [Flavobacterium pallidum]AWI25298.1 hypothetical protein HYN49_04950 [Flavobacterium pallidum]
MTIKLLFTTAAILLLGSPIYAQAPAVGPAGTFALFTSNGAVSNTGLSHITGNVGTNNGSSTNFGNVDGNMHDGDGTTAAASADLSLISAQLGAAIPGYFPAPLLGNGQVLTEGTYAIGQTASLNGMLTLDAQNDPNAVFIFQIGGAFSSAANAQVLLVNGAMACNVFWRIEGLVDLATNTSIKGTIVAVNAAIILNTGVTLEGRALSTTGAVTGSGITVTTPLGCNTPTLNGPVAAPLASVACYTIFSGNGQVTNTGITFITGDVGTNSGITTGFQAENVTGTIHPNPDVSTATAAADLNTASGYISTLPTDIELLYPATLGNSLVLTPHTYLLNGATVLTGILYLNAQGNTDAVFVLKVSGAFSTSTYATIVLQNGAQAKNVFWKVDGAVNLNDYADFKGTMIVNNGAIIVNTGVTIEGRALATSGGVSTFGINAQMTSGCNALAIDVPVKQPVKLYPNPFSSVLNVTVDSGSSNIVIYNVTGMEVYRAALHQEQNTIYINVPAGVYFYKVEDDKGYIQSGRLISE